MSTAGDRALAVAAPALERLLRSASLPPPQFGAAEIECRTLRVKMRDGVLLATDIYLPPTRPAPVVVIRTPYGRASEASGLAAALTAFARRGYVAVAQDCRGTGDSQPDHWDYYMFEAEDGVDCVEWITQQTWYDGFIGSFGGSYAGQTQWCMATHPAMSAIAPSVSGLGIAVNTAHTYMFLNAYAKVIGRGHEKLDLRMDEMERHFETETMAGGFFNAPLEPQIPETIRAQNADLSSLPAIQASRALWAVYCAKSGAERTAFIKQARETDSVTLVDVEHMASIFGKHVAHDALTLPHIRPADAAKTILAPPLMRTGWYDWGLNDALCTWQALQDRGEAEVAAHTRLLITPNAHNAPGYHVAALEHPDLLHSGNALNQAGLLLEWYKIIQSGDLKAWPRVIYYLMGANEWRAADCWPPAGAQQLAWWLAGDGRLATTPPTEGETPDGFIYDPHDPTPTIGGSIVSYLYRPGSADVSQVQQRADVLVYTSAPLEEDIDVVGPIRLVLHASSTATDTDFVVRLSDVFPDGRAIQLQSSIMRARYRDIENPALLTPGEVYEFDIDLWATANRFKAGHRIRLDIASADFPHYDRNNNRGGEPGEPVSAEQRVYHDTLHPSRLLLSVLNPLAARSRSRLQTKRTLLCSAP